MGMRGVAAVGVALIPCPVCRGPLRVRGMKSAARIGRVHRHRASTDPLLYESRRLDAVIADVHEVLAGLADPMRCNGDDHLWVGSGSPSKTPTQLCVRCLTLALVDSGSAGVSP